MTLPQKCSGETVEAICPMRDTCRLHLKDAITGPWFKQPPLYQLSDGGEWKCDEYWKI